jgi:hypothetical protein
MTAPYDPFESLDEPDDSGDGETLARATRRLRTMHVPPVPADLFAASTEEAKVAPLVALRGEAVPKASWGRTKAGLAFVAGTLALAAIGFIVGGYRFGLPAVSDRGDGVAQVDPQGDDPREVAVRSDIAPHPRLETLATQTAALKGRVQALRMRAEAAGARRQADQLLARYSRP